MMDKQFFADWAGAHAEEQLTLLRTLAAIPSPSHQEERRAAFILDWLRANGGTDAYIDPACNVVLPIGCEGRQDIRVYMAHTDVVFPDLEPLPVYEKDGRLYAPGVGDDTANVTALMLFARHLLETKHGGPLLLVWNSCEEGLGNLKGVRQIMADFQGRVRELVSFDGQYTGLVERAVGSERWSVKVATPGGHSYGAFGNPNAIVHLANLIQILDHQSLPHVEGRKVTYNVGTISGGTSVNTIAQSAEMTYEYRSDDAGMLAVMRRQFEEAVQAAAADDVRFDVTMLGERPCGGNVPAEWEEALLERCAAAITAVTGQPPARRSSSTDANIPLSLGVPATAFGLYLGAKSHTREEYIEIASLRVGLQIGLMLICS